MHPIKDFRPATEQERMYCYAQSHEIQMKTGMIGYLRGDFGTNGGLFYTTWFDAPGGEKTQAFKDEFDDLVNALRSDPEFHGILKSRTAMSAYCHSVPESAMDGNYASLLHHSLLSFNSPSQQHTLRYVALLSEEHYTNLNYLDYYNIESTKKQPEQVPIFSKIYRKE